MKRRNVVRRLLALVLSVVMAATMLPMMGAGGTAKAAVAQDKTVAGLSTSAIKAPKAPSSVSDAWTGSYVWYGKYGGTPVKYRVLAPKTTIYGGTTMLLDCDSILYTAPFDDDMVANTGAQKPNEWKYSDVKAGLNGSAFLTKANGFTTIEKNAIAKSTIASHALVEGTAAGQVAPWTKDAYVNYVALSGEKIFLLDGEDVSNSLYGYYYYDNSVAYKVKKDSGGNVTWWWLRSANTYYDYRAGCVQSTGVLHYDSVNYVDGVSPAININLSSVIFTSVITGTAGQDNAEYKLTLADSNLTVGIANGKTGSISGSKVTIPYVISGADAKQATRVSVLILDKEYKAGNTNNATIKYYGKLNVQSTGTSPLNGTGTFTLPSGLTASGWGSSYYVYLLAEIENGIHETDYASVPVKLTKSGSNVTSITISKQPASTSAVAGDQAKFSVTAAGYGTLSYQWQYRKNSTSSWASSAQSGNKTATLSVAATNGLNGYQFRCVITDGNGQKAYSNAATLSISPMITTQPVDKSLLVGSTAKFTVTATGKGTLTYQWQYRKNESASWANSGQQGAKTDTLLVSTTAALHGYQFRCIVTDGNGKKSYSKTVTLTLKPRITTQPVDKSLLVGSTAKFTIAATGKATLTYQWQYRKNETSDWANSGQTGAKTDTLLVSTTAALHGYQFRCIATDGNGQKSYSKTVTLTLKPRITTQPVDKSVTAGSTAKFTVAATGKATLTYQWQYRKNSSSAWANSGQSGNKTATLSVASTKSLNGYQFRCIVTDGNGQKSYSNTVTMTVK
ncbi:MAG: hypothetical protein J6Y20_14830 [Lachnospiraceae bacterium]|nr:hypothetical protein [Lachnospiraceae bacterium]